MSAEVESRSKRIVEAAFKIAAKTFLTIHRPLVIVTAGSVGKTSSKLMLARLLETEKSVSYMDDSYNKGLGLYLSIFQQKVPDVSSPLSWVVKLLQAAWYTLTHHQQYGN